MSPDGLPLGIALVIIGIACALATGPLTAYSRRVWRNSSFRPFREITPKFFIWEGAAIAALGVTAAIVIGLVDK